MSGPRVVIALRGRAVVVDLYDDEHLNDNLDECTRLVDAWQAWQVGEDTKVGATVNFENYPPIDVDYRDIVRVDFVERSS